MDLVMSSDTDSDVTVLTVAGDVDAVSAASLRDGIESHVVAGRNTLVLDLDGVSFMDSTGLGALVAGLRLTKVHQGSMLLCRVPARVHRVMLITGLDEIFDPYSSRDEAVEAARMAITSS